jgi:hypothetical protein
MWPVLAVAPKLRCNFYFPTQRQSFHTAWVMGRLWDFVSATTGVPQIAAEWLYRASRQSRATARNCCALGVTGRLADYAWSILHRRRFRHHVKPEDRWTDSDPTSVAPVRRRTRLIPPVGRRLTENNRDTI